MSQIQLKEVKSGTVHDVDANGAVIGREPNDAKIVIRDRAVSKQHARVFLKNGTWFLEDLKSSNGTYYDGEKIEQPVALKAGDLFSVAIYDFEVVSVGAAKATPRAETITNAEKAPEEPAPSPASRENKKPKRNAMEEAEAAAAPSRSSTSTKSKAPPSGIPADAKSFGYYMVAVPKAIAYYLVNIPLLLVNPMGTVRRSIEEPKLPPMGAPELIAYALPATVFAALVGAICTFIAGALNKTFLWSALFPVGPLIGAVIAAVVGGFICHPFLKWFVSLLKGNSDETSRSNFFVQMQAAAVIVAIPNGLGIILGAIPFVRAISPLVMLLGTLVTLFISYSWFTSFNVVKWFRMVLLALGALAALGSVGNMGNLLYADIKARGSSSGAVAATGTEEKAEKEAEKETEKAAENKEEEKKPAEEEKKPGKEKTEKVEKAENKAKPEENATPPKEEEPQIRKPKKSSKSDDGYRDYATKRAEVEKAIADNPTVLKSNKRVLGLYTDLLKKTYAVKNDGGGKKKKKEDPALDALHERLDEADVYEATKDVIADLHRELVR